MQTKVGAPLLLMLISCLVVGCGGGGRLFPTDVGTKHQYLVKNGMALYVEGIEAMREVPVMGCVGAEFSGPMGTSRLAWKDDTLYASMLAGTRFSPPIPFLVASLPKDAVTAKTTLDSAGTQQEATVTLVHGAEEIKLGTQDIETVRVLMTLHTSSKTITVETNFAPGTGIVRQQQHVDGKFDMCIDLLD